MRAGLNTFRPLCDPRATGGRFHPLIGFGLPTASVGLAIVDDELVAMIRPNGREVATRDPPPRYNTRLATILEHRSSSLTGVAARDHFQHGVNVVSLIKHIQCSWIGTDCAAPPPFE